LRGTHQAFLDLFARYMGRFRVPEAPPDGVRFSADSGQEKMLPGGRLIPGKRSLYLSYGRIHVGRSDDEMAGTLIALIRDWTTQLANEFIRLRAGAVTVADGAILLPSLPEPHLAGLVASFVKHGAGYIGDELLNLDPVLRTVSGLGLPIGLDGSDLQHFPELGRVRPGGRRRPPPEQSRGATPRHPVSPEELGSSQAEPAPAAWIVFPDFEDGASTVLEPFGGAAAVMRFSQAVLNLDAWEDRALLLVRDLLESAAVSRLVVGSFDDAASLLMRTAPGLMKGVIA
jgi:hypothetical protein